MKVIADNLHANDGSILSKSYTRKQFRAGLAIGNQFLLGSILARFYPMTLKAARYELTYLI